MINNILAYLENKRWEFEQTEEDVIATGFTIDVDSINAHEQQEFGLFIMPIMDLYGDRFVRFSVVPYIEQTAIGYPYDLCIRTMQINHDIPGLKFALDGAGDLELIYDLPTDQLNENQFDRVLQLLGDFSGIYYKELLQLVGSTSETTSRDSDYLSPVSENKHDD